MKRNISLISILAILAFIFALHPDCKKGNKIPSLKQSENFNLLLITIDAMRADRIGAFGFMNAHTPNLDRMAENGIMFRNCYASVPLSLPSHCTIFTGREPFAHRVRNNGTDYLPEAEQTWAEVMKNKDYETHALVSSYLLHSKFGLKQGFDNFDDSLEFNQIINNSGTAIAADRIFIRFQSWLEQRPLKKFFAWVNFSDPLAPHESPQEYARMFENDPYSAEVANVDHYIGEMMHALEAKKLLDRTVIVVAGSHGEALYEHREWGHGLFCYEETLKVPLIIYNPEVFAEKQVIESRVRLLDLMPSLLQLFNLESPAGVLGKSFLPLLSKKNQEKQTDQPVYFESMYGFEEMGFAPLTGLITENYKYISLPEAELYDLQTDPAERENLAQKKNDLARKMDAHLQSYIVNHTEKKQESLGEENRKQGETQAVDPKKGIAAIERMLKVEQLIYSEKLGEAETELQGIISDYQDWKLPQVSDYQYLIYKKKNDPGKIEGILKQAAEKYPEISHFRLSLAQILADSGRLKEAEEICAGELARDPRLSQANILLGKIYQKMGGARLALSHMEKALEQEPLNISLQVEYAGQIAELGEKEKSLDILKNLLKNRSLIADPESTDIKADIGGLLIKIGEYEMANTLLLDIVANGKGNTMVWTQIGLGNFNKGNLEKARESFEKALSLDQHNALALSSMGTFYLSLFRTQKQKDLLEKAIAYYTQAMNASPLMVAAINGLGVALRYAGDNEKAIAFWKQALQIDPGFTSAYFNLGITLLETGRKQEALKYLSICREKYSDRLGANEKKQLDTLIAETKQ
jgi:arylsulfatase A-like enzyme/Tfp pilus assembly protein PilF